MNVITREVEAGESLPPEAEAFAQASAARVARPFATIDWLSLGLDRQASPQDVRDFGPRIQFWITRMYLGRISKITKS